MPNLPCKGGQMCPACDAEEITLEFLNKKGVKGGQIFECPICGTKMLHTTRASAIGPILFLHIVYE
jgi:Zn ribbon nucleic-acid-binding protein